MSDLQAAAERLRKHISRRPSNPSPYAKQDKKGEAYFDSGEMEFDTFKTSRAFLALTDPTPIDEAWLREIGADHRLNGEWLVADPRTLGECVEVWCIFTEDGEPPAVIVKPSNHDDCPCIIANCTRGQLNALLHALKEAPRA